MKKGFTLIELIIVVAIIGILASIVLVGLGGFRAKGRDARRTADLRQVQNGLELYFAKNGAYPPSTSWNTGTAPGNLTLELIAANVGVNQVPNDPVAAKSYGYCLDSATGRYTVGAVLEDINNPALTQPGAGTPPCQPATIPNLAPDNLCNTASPATSKKLCNTL